MLQKFKEFVGVILVLTFIISCIWYAINYRKPKKYVHNRNQAKVELIDSFFCKGKKEIQYIYLIEYKKHEQIIIN